MGSLRMPRLAHKYHNHWPIVDFAEAALVIFDDMERTSHSSSTVERRIQDIPIEVDGIVK